MTITSQIIHDAFRASNLLAITQEPTALQQAEALRHLSRLVKSVLGFEVGEGLVAYPVGSLGVSRPSWAQARWPSDTDWYVPQNVRLVLNNEVPVELFLDPSPEDGARIAAVAVSPVTTNTVTLNANGMLIDGAATAVINTNGFNGEWLYRADLAEWVRVVPLSVDMVFPFPEEFDDFFILMLAMRLNPAYGAGMDPQSQAILSRSRVQIGARYQQSQEMTVEQGLYRLPRMTADGQMFQGTRAPSRNYFNYG